MRSIHLSIITIVCITIGIVSPHAFADTKELVPIIAETQFQLKVNQTTSLESDNIKVKFLNVTSDSRCPSDVTCVWQGEVKIFFNIVENNQDVGDFSLTNRAGQQDLATQFFDGHSIQVVRVEPYPTNDKKISLSDYVATFAISKSGILSPLKQFKSGIALKDINCNSSLQLVSKAEDNSPACVKPGTAARLIELAWAKEIINKIE